jgi:hypothetical protein
MCNRSVWPSTLSADRIRVLKRSYKQGALIAVASITLDTALKDEGVICTHPVFGAVAAIARRNGQWEVYPYSVPPVERVKRFKSYQAAEFYALALAYEMHERGKGHGRCGRREDEP